MVRIALRLRPSAPSSLEKYRVMSETAGISSSDLCIASAGAAFGELSFRIRGGDYHGRLVRIRAAKCTIGAAADCTLRLVGPGVRPLHCIVQRGDTGPTVRRWSPDTQLNGRAFNDALLMTGDRLQIGPIELEVVDEAELAARNRQAAVMEVSPGGPPPLADLASEIAGQIRSDLRRDKDLRKRRLQRKRLHEAKQRVKRLEADLQRSAQVSQRLEYETSRLLSETKIAQHERLHAETQLAQAEARLSRVQQEGDAGSELMQQLRRQVEEARALIERNSSDWRAERETLQQTLAALKDQLARREAELASAQADFAAQSANWNERGHLQPPPSQPRIGTDAVGQSPEDLQAEREAWQREKQSLLKVLDEKAHHEHRLEVALSEMRKAVDQEHLAASDERQKLEEERIALEVRTRELNELQAWCDDLVRQTQRAPGHAEVMTEEEAQHFRDRIAELEALLRTSDHDGQDARTEADRIRQDLSQTASELDNGRALLAQSAAALEEALAARQGLLERQGELESLLSSRTEELAARQADSERQQQQLADHQTRCRELETGLEQCRQERDALSARVQDLERQLQSAAESHHQIETELLARSESIAAAQGEVQELRSQVRQREEDAVLQEQNFTRRIECLEKLARNLEDELQIARANSDALERLEGEKRQLQVEFSSAQQQWSEQRQVLEEQALAAHQRLHEAEDQVGNLRGALSSTQSEVSERDNLLAQMREEVRQQVTAWQTDRNRLQAELDAALKPAVEPSQPPSPERTEGDLSGAEAELLASGSPATQVEWLPEQQSPDANGQMDHDGQADRCTEPSDAAESLSQACDDCATPPPALELPPAPVASPPVSVNDVLVRLEAAGIWKDEASSDIDEEATSCDREASQDVDQAHETVTELKERSSSLPTGLSSFNSAPRPVFEKAAGSSAAPPPPPGNDDESIEAYMSRLLKRVRGDAVANTFTLQVKAERAAVSEGEPTPLLSQPCVTSKPSLEPEQYLPRKSAPELPSEMAAMRELAVHSARQAINHSSQRRFQKKALAVTGAAWFSLASGIGLFAWAWDTGNRLAWAGSIFLLVIGAFLTAWRVNLRLPQPAAGRTVIGGGAQPAGRPQ